MFVLELYDSFGNPLQMGDFVKIEGNFLGCFYAEVKYLPELEIITPFHTFSFHQFEKVDKIPEGALESTEERYKIFYMPNSEKGERISTSYLMEWRQCEHLQKNRLFRIKLLAGI